MGHRLTGWAVMALALWVPAVAGAADEGPLPPGELFRQTEPVGFAQRDTLTGGWFGGKEWLEARGLSVDLFLTQVYQFNVEGGLATHRHAGRWTGSYDLEVGADLERLVDWKGATLFILSEGSWSDGIDESSVGSLFGVNADAAGDRSIDVTELWLQQMLADGRVQVRIGKVDLTGTFNACRGCVSFDGNAFANDENTQFLNGALVNNPTIPFPEQGLGVMVMCEPVEGWYVAGGVADAQADARETGFNTAFHDEDYTFSIYETGVMPVFESATGPLPGTYRIGLWYDPQPKDRLDGTGTRRDDVGMYLSFDQLVCREGPDDDQGLGLFFRYGLADEHVNPIHYFWSAGLQYRGPIPGRDADVLGFGMARARLSDDDPAFTEAHETAFEVYYNAEVCPSVQITPSVQVVRNPGGDETVGDAVVVEVRALVAF